MMYYNLKNRECKKGKWNIKYPYIKCAKKLCNILVLHVNLFAGLSILFMHKNISAVQQSAKYAKFSLLGKNYLHLHQPFYRCKFKQDFSRKSNFPSAISIMFAVLHQDHILAFVSFLLMLVVAPRKIICCSMVKIFCLTQEMQCSLKMKLSQNLLIGRSKCHK